jgi:Polyketide cyclase / dehydrase and lipid transport
MVTTHPSNLDRDYRASRSFPIQTPSVDSLSDHRSKALLNGEILLETRSHTAWGAAVTAQMYLPLSRESVWEQLTDYPRWVQYLPDVTQSRVLTGETSTSSTPKTAAIAQPSGIKPSDQDFKRIYQAASKTFLFLTAQVEVYLRVFETLNQHVQFRLESGNFNDFLAEAKLRDLADGTLLTYFVQATPTIPVPSVLIQQAIHFDLPANLRQMRQVLCKK